MSLRFNLLRVVLFYFVVLFCLFVLGKFIYVVVIMFNVFGDKWLDKDEMDWEDE